jgi:hypothetical protein
MKPPRSALFLRHVGAGVRHVFLKPRFLLPVIAGAAIIGIQGHAGWQAWRHGTEVAWASPAATVLTTLTALWIAVAIVRTGGDDGSGSTSLFSVARGLATGYYFNFLKPLVGCLRQAERHPGAAGELFTVQLDGQPLERLPALHGLVVAIPCRSAQVCRTPAAGAALIADRCTGLQMHTVVFDRVRHAPDAVWSRPIELRLLQEHPGGPAVLLDVPTTLNVIHETLGRQPAAHGGESPLQQASDRFVQVLHEFRDVVAQVGGADPLRHRSPLQVHVVPAEVAEHRIRELLSSGT